MNHNRWGPLQYLVLLSRGIFMGGGGELGIEPGPADRTHLAAKSVEDTRPSLAVVTIHTATAAQLRKEVTPARNSPGKTSLSNCLSSVN
jgi:hypothetical protein